MLRGRGSRDAVLARCLSAGRTKTQLSDFSLFSLFVSVSRPSCWTTSTSAFRTPARAARSAAGMDGLGPTPRHHQQPPPRHRVTKDRRPIAQFAVKRTHRPKAISVYRRSIEKFQFVIVQNAAFRIHRSASSAVTIHRQTNTRGSASFKLASKCTAVRRCSAIATQRQPRTVSRTSTCRTLR